MLRNIPIRRKVMMVNLLTSGVVLLVTCFAFAILESAALHRRAVQGLKTRAEVVAAISAPALAYRDVSDATAALASFKIDPQVVAACIYDVNGHVFATYPTNAPASVFPPLLTETQRQFGPLSVVVFAPIIHDGRKLGTVFLHSDLSSLVGQYRAFAWLAVGIFACSVLLAYLLSLVLQRQISRPILALADTARAVSGGKDFSVRAVKFGRDELGDLTDAFNEMLAEIHKLNDLLEQRVHERTAQLEAVNKELEAFSYSVSHDLRAPLRHIDGFADLLRKDAQDKLSPSGQRYLGVISDAARQMGALIDDLLVFSRMGRAEMRQERVNMDALLAEVLRETEEDCRARVIEWDIQPLPEVQGDRPMLKQVWVNLISNALKYSRHRSPARIKISGRENESGALEFSVRDNGAGFDMRYVGKLFGVFQRLHMNEDFEGTGIGLANVRRIIVRHGGQTWAEGKVDAGATFYFSLPKPPSEKNKT